MGYESVVVSKADLKWGLTKDGCCPENKYIHGKTGFKKKKKNRSSITKSNWL